LPGIISEPVPVDARMSLRHRWGFLEGELLGERSAPRQSQYVNLRYAGSPIDDPDLLQ